jgi:uncharacterized protein YdcH (DUF465 family)
MSLDNIQSLEKKFESMSELQAYADSQYRVIIEQSKLISQLHSEVAHLKSLLSSSELVDEKATKIIASTEQSICEIEIERLKETALQRGLTLEETKRLDLLVKNLLLSKEQSKSIPTTFRHLSNISNATLIEIASQPDPEDV